MENTNSNFSPVFSGRVLWVGLTPARDTNYLHCLRYNATLI